LENYREFIKEFKNFNQQMDTLANKIPLMILYSLMVAKSLEKYREFWEEFRGFNQ
jgi:hypothetical protein